MKIQYLEIVTQNVDATCALYSNLHQVNFSACQPSLGNAKTATLNDGSLIGIRAPLRSTEAPITRSYFLVENIDMAVEKAEQSGAQVALPPTQLPGYGTCAIIIYGQVEFGFWAQP